jgi:signal transduction histidine kinase
MYSIDGLPAPIRWILHPWRMAILILATTFFFEWALMIILPAIAGDKLGKWGMAAIDAFLLTVLLAPCIWGLMVRPLQRIADTRKQLFEWAMTTEERKAGEISRDLHDNFGQLLTSITVGLRTIEEVSKEPAVVGHARRIRATGLELHGAIRSLARGLRPTVLDDLGLSAALANLASDWHESSGVAIDLSIEELKSQRLASSMETTVYRIAQESITNAIRHGSAKRIHIVGQLNSSRLMLSIEDNGCGFALDDKKPSPTSRRPFGLISMRERAESIGATLSIRSSLGKGTRVELVANSIPPSVVNQTRTL